MLRPGDKIDPRVRRRRQVALAIDSRVDQRRSPTIVFIRRVAEEYLRHHPGLLGPDEQTIRQSALRVGLGLEGERKDVGRIEKIEERTRVTRGLREPVIEAAASAARDVSPYSIKHLLPLLAGVESVVEELSQEAPALRGAYRNRVLVPSFVLQVGDVVANARGTETGQCRVLSGVGYFVDPARLKPALHIDMSTIFFEPPLAARNLAALAVDAVPHGHPDARRVGDRVGNMRPVRHVEPVDPFVRDVIGSHHAFDALGGGSIEPHQPGRIRRDVPLPSQPQQRESLFQEKVVSELSRRARIGRGSGFSQVEGRQHSLSPAVRHLEENRAVVSGRLEHVEIRREFDQSLLVPRAVIDVGNDAVRREPGIDSEVNLAGDLCVRPGRLLFRVDPDHGRSRPTGNRQQQTN